MLKNAKKTSQKVTISFETPSKNFFAWTFREVCKVYDISKAPVPPLTVVPEFTGIEPAALDSDSEKKILSELKAEVGKFVDVLILKGANEATKSLVVGLFLANVTALFKQDMYLVAQQDLRGRRGNGPVDFSVHSRKYDLYTLGVTEVKKDDFPQDLAQNLVQLESAITEGNKRKRDEEDQPMVPRSYGVVTDATTWYLTECTIHQDNTVTFRMKMLGRAIMYEDDWQDDVEFVFKRLVWLWSRMADEIPKKTEIGPPQKKVSFLATSL